MNSSKKPLSAFRYFKAGLKPFKKFSFWGPPSIIAIIAICYWQYRSNPAWLNTSFEQPEGVESVLSDDPYNPDNPEIGLEMPLQSIARDAQNQNQQAQEQLPLVDPLSPEGAITSPTGEQNESPSASPEGTFGLGQLTQNQKDEAKEESSTPQIFTPLMPNIKTPSSIFSNNSKSQKQNNSANPPALSPIDGLMKPKPVTVTENPLQNAMEQTSSSDSVSSTELNSTTNQSEISPSEVSGANSNNSFERSQPTSNDFSNQSAATQPFTQNYQTQAPYYYKAPGNVNSAQQNSTAMQQIYQNPYLNSPVQIAPAQPSTQSYQPSYNNSPIPTNPSQTSVQPSQSQSPYLNSPVQQTPSVTQTEYF